jgi:transposase
MKTVYYLGVDVAKETLQAALTIDGKNMNEFAIGNNAKDIRLLFQNLTKQFAFGQEQLIVCLEHTGIYAYPLLDYLVKQNIKICLESAVQIKQSQGMTRGKSDKVDAVRIAKYVYKNRDELRFWTPQREVIQKLQAYLVLRDRLINVKGQLLTPLNESVRFIDKSITNTLMKICAPSIKALAEALEKIGKELKDLINADASVKKQLSFASSVTGVGQIVGLTFIVTSGEFKRIREPKKFACHAGVAPYEHSSGTSVRGKTRVSKMANMDLKRLLFLAAMSAIQHSPEMKSYYERKLAEGKMKMCVINAVKNKLITRVFACVQQERKYQKNYTMAFG